MNPLRKAWRYLRLQARARALASLSAGVSSPGEWFDLVCRFDDFRPLQHKVEIVGLMDQLVALEPSRVMEIGSWHGGTAFLFARVAARDATLILLDSGFDAAYRAALRRLAGTGQRVICLSDDSHLPATRERVAGLLGGAPLDFLLIDGDHAYEGVAQDFRDYGPLVRAGGIIAFHDVVQDHGQRFGRATNSYSGGVWKFWAELRQRYGAATSELIADRDQDGAGIGVLRWPGAA